MTPSPSGSGPVAGELRERSPGRFRADELHRELNRRLRTAFLAGAEEQMRRDHGRGLTDDELRRVMAEYPGDLPEQLSGMS